MGQQHGLWFQRGVGQRRVGVPRRYWHPAQRRELIRRSAGGWAMQWKAKIYIGSVIALGMASLALASWTMDHPIRFLAILVTGILASGLKVSLPGILGTMSLSYIF